MYVLVKDGAVEQFPYYLSDLKKAHKNTSFPTVPSDEQLAAFNVFRIHGNPEPTYDYATQLLEYPAPVFDGSKWVQTSFVRSKTAEELAATGAVLQDAIVTATQARLDSFAKTRNYDSIHTAAAYGLSKKLKYKGEGQAAVDAMTDTWDALYAILAEVQAGTRPMPASFEDIEPDLPVLAWPSAS